MRVFIVYLSTRWGVCGREHHVIALSEDEEQLDLVTLKDIAIAKAKLNTKLTEEVTKVEAEELFEGFHEIFDGGF